jgi:serine protease inhibitor
VNLDGGGNGRRNRPRGRTPAEAPPKVRVDRPFLFAVRDTPTGTPLFLGRVLDPSG